MPHDCPLWTVCHQRCHRTPVVCCHGCQRWQRSVQGLRVYAGQSVPRIGLLIGRSEFRAASTLGPRRIGQVAQSVATSEDDPQPAQRIALGRRVSAPSVPKPAGAISRKPRSRSTLWPPTREYAPELPSRRTGFGSQAHPSARRCASSFSPVRRGRVAASGCRVSRSTR